MEFDEASAAGVPRLVFLLDDTVGMPGVLADADRGAVEGFRQRLRDGELIVRGFASDDRLELEVFHALTEVVGGARPGLPGMGPPGVGGAVLAAGSGGVVAIHAIGGMPGVGKTASPGTCRADGARPVVLAERLGPPIRLGRARHRRIAPQRLPADPQGHTGRPRPDWQP
jgi:hypothetical protein